MAFPALDYESVRKSIDLTLTSVGLPNATIDLPTFAGRAEQDVMDRDPLAASYTAATDGKYEHVERAYALLTAARLALAWHPKEQVSFASNDISFRNAKWDGAARAAQLRADANSEFAAYLEDADTLGQAIAGFWRIPGGRGA